MSLGMGAEGSDESCGGGGGGGAAPRRPPEGTGRGGGAGSGEVRFFPSWAFWAQSVSYMG